MDSLEFMVIFLPKVAEDLLAYFLEHKAYDCFAACLFQVKKLAYIYSVEI